MVVGASPVCDHNTLVSPLVPEYVLQQVGIFIGISSVYLIVACHQGLCVSLFDSDFKTGQIYFP